MTRGRVVARFGADLILRDESGHLFKAIAPRNLVKQGPEYLRVPVCGDMVTFEHQIDKALLTKIEQRRNALVRPDHRGRPRISVANIDLIVIVMATRPPPDWGLIDRYLVGAADLGANVLIIINKIDLPLDKTATQHIADTQSLYDNLGYEVLPTSTRNGTGIESFKAHLAGKTALLVGQSGVGKSSLTHALDPSLDIRIGELSALTGEGKHTTTHAHLYAMPYGGDLIDSPGVRDFAPYAPNRQALLSGFPEIAKHLGQCRFHNCQHRSEPGCVIKAYAETGEISATRLRNFITLSDETKHTDPR